MADDADRAQHHIERELEAAIRAARGQPSATYAAIQPKECAECGEMIPEARQRLVPGCELCSVCAGRVESLRARGLI